MLAIGTLGYVVVPPPLEGAGCACTRPPMPDHMWVGAGTPGFRPRLLGRGRLVGCGPALFVEVELLFFLVVVGIIVKIKVGGFAGLYLGLLFQGAWLDRGVAALAQGEEVVHEQ